MTLLEVTNLIYESFLSNSVLTPDLVIKDHKLILDLPCTPKQLIKAGLDELAKLNICRLIEGTDYYVLIEDLHRVTQKLEVKSDIGVLLVKELNKLLVSMDKKEASASVGNLNDMDLANIVLALRILNEEVEKRAKEKDDSN